VSRSRRADVVEGALEAQEQERRFFAYMIRHALSKSAPVAFGDGDGELPPDPAVVLFQGDLQDYADWIERKFGAVNRTVYGYYKASPRPTDPSAPWNIDLRTPDGKAASPLETEAVILLGTQTDAWKAYYAENFSPGAFEKRVATSLFGGEAGKVVFLNLAWRELQAWHEKLRGVSAAFEASGYKGPTLSVPIVPSTLEKLRAFLKAAAKEFGDQLEDLQALFLLAVVVAGGFMLASHLPRR
jgi:hypothetical protein